MLIYPPHRPHFEVRAQWLKEICPLFLAVEMALTDTRDPLGLDKQLLIIQLSLINLCIPLIDKAPHMKRFT